ncbi:NAD-dependent epimerase/dehydratase family protein [Nakamurella silvestris]|nr:NAD-dependent epimerase/dehydratase family protein [Nakamurella silvestris]
MHVIIGSGPIGSATATALLARGERVTMVSRSSRPAPGSVPTSTDLAFATADAADTAQLIGATAGATAIYNCVNPAYHRWPTDWPPVAAALLDAAETHSAVLVTASNLYPYGRGSGVMSEDTPARPSDHKGEVRQQMWLDALARHQAGRVRVTEARASDYLGPFATDGAHAGSRLIEPLLAGKTIRPIGDPDVLRSWTYLPDIGETMATLGLDERAWGRLWHVPSPAPKSFRTLAADLAAEAKVSLPKISPVPSWLINAAGLVNPMMKEIKGVAYQFTETFVMDSSRATAELGLTTTAWPQILADTVSWWRGKNSPLNAAA